MEIELTAWELGVIRKALKAYEEDNYKSENDTWQKKINNLMEKLYAKQNNIFNQ